jgi:hypothetical protein
VVRMANSRFLHYAVAGAPAPVGMTRGESRWRSGFGRNDKSLESAVRVKIKVKGKRAGVPAPHNQNQPQLLQKASVAVWLFFWG